MVSTLSTAAVNARPDPALLLSVSALARRRGRDKALVSRQVTKLVGAGRLSTYAGERGEKLVNFVEFERALGETVDGVKEQAAATARLFRDDPAPTETAGADDNSLASAQRRKLLVETELRNFELLERRGQLLPIGEINKQIGAAGDALVQLLDRLPLRAAEVAAATAKDGEIGVRALLKSIAFELRAGIAEIWEKFEAEGLAEEAAGPIAVELAEETA
jgi:hypothetical protein